MRQDDIERKAIHVGGFPAVVWRVFAAQCKVQGRCIVDVLEEVLRDWIKREGK